MKAIGIILAGGSSERRLGDLTLSRAASAMPVGGSYRTIDFPLSNMSNSGIQKVAVIAQYNSRSLQDHLSSAKWWDFGRRNGGLFVLTPYVTNDNAYWFRGTADSMYQNMSFLKRSHEKYVVITSGDCVYKMDYNDIIKAHAAKGADITIVTKNFAQDKDLTKMGIVETDAEGRVIEFEEKPVEPQSDEASLGIYVMERTLLMKILDEIVPDDRYDFVKDVLIGMRRKLKIYAYKFDGYWNSIGGGIVDYYNANMDFLKKEIRDNFAKEKPYIATKPKDEPPAKYNLDAEVSNSVVGNGAIINGKVEGSVIFRRVYVGEKASVKDSILMENCHIGNNCVLEYVIFDKGVTVSDGVVIKGEKDKPFVVKKNSTL
ncbi:MAG: glucose-1-phosphate adenylyltransferase subunit GlgD [Firmicutes bacterium]|nr:glucose-1-phosphate adenylyltransferase subunit GlgD [Bacillota bacterium]